ncbi:hypothetical protein pb186bvf_018118 [Paramecium bursaria]
MSSQRKITWEEVAKNQNSNWIVIEDTVYDPSTYLDSHPGGPAVLQNRAGKDATQDFLDTGHGAVARRKLEEFKVGIIDQSSQPAQWQKGGGTPVNAQKFALIVVAVAIMTLFCKFLCFCQTHLRKNKKIRKKEYNLLSSFFQSNLPLGQ